MKTIICLLHGLTDSPLKDLGGLTPLQKAHKTHLKALARQGEIIKIAPPEGAHLEEALLSLFGVQQDLSSVSQGTLEAYSLGLSLSPHQRAFSVRFVSAGQGTVVDTSEHLIGDNEGRALCSSLNALLGEIGFNFLPIQGPRAVLISEHPALVQTTQNKIVHPAEAIGKKWVELLPEGPQQQELTRLIARAVALLGNHEVNQVRADLEEQPVNALLLFNGGGPASWKSLEKGVDYSSMRLYTPSATSQGVARALGIEVQLMPPEQRKYYQVTSFLNQLNEGLKAKDVLIGEFFYLWQSTQKGELLEKIKTIELLDRQLIQPLVKYCELHSCRLALLPLRHADIRAGKLSPGEVPALVYNPLRLMHSNHHFDERSLTLLQQTIPLHSFLKMINGERLFSS